MRPHEGQQKRKGVVTEPTRCGNLPEAKMEVVVQRASKSSVGKSLGFTRQIAARLGGFGSQAARQNPKGVSRKCPPLWLALAGSPNLPGLRLPPLFRGEGRF